MKFSFMQNPLTQIPFFAWIYNSFINSHLLEWLKVRQIKSGIRVNFDQCVRISGPETLLNLSHFLNRLLSMLLRESQMKTTTYFTKFGKNLIQKVVSTSKWNI